MATLAASEPRADNSLLIVDDDKPFLFAPGEGDGGPRLQRPHR